VYESSRRDKYPVTVKGGVVDLSVRDLLNGFVNPAERDKDRRQREDGFPDPDLMESGTPKEVHYHTHQHVDIGEGVSNSVINLGDENKIQQSITNAGIPPELKETLLQLAEAVNAMQTSLPKEEAEEVQECMEQLVKEAKKPKPNPKWYRVSIEGLTEAAQKLEKLGTPVIQLAGKVLSLLGD
jgi:predicted RNA-binding protein with RPS1 domain